MKSQSGFTLVEMVAVIIILAVLAANALPKFTSLSGDARYSSLNALMGGFRSAVTLSRAKWLVAQSGTLDSVDFNGTAVSVINLGTVGSAVTNLGSPLATGTGIDRAMDSLGTYTSGTDGVGGVSYWPTGVTTSSSCYVNYLSGTVTITPNTAATATSACS